MDSTKNKCENSDELDVRIDDRLKELENGC